MAALWVRYGRSLGSNTDISQKYKMRRGEDDSLEEEEEVGKHKEKADLAEAKQGRKGK
jgi:hypothetical protein